MGLQVCDEPFPVAVNRQHADERRGRSEVVLGEAKSGTTGPDDRDDEHRDQDEEENPRGHGRKSARDQYPPPVAEVTN
ncbi:MAG: hypothetical protein ACRDRK_10740 [Pseudonocardia sp.]